MFSLFDEGSPVKFQYRVGDRVKSIRTEAIGTIVGVEGDEVVVCFGLWFCLHSANEVAPIKRYWN